MLNPSYLYGLHDQEAASHIPDGGWCLALKALSENWEPVNYAAINPRINWIVRVNWGYGTTGTIPRQDEWGTFYSRLVNFLRGTQGCSHIIIGNEPNHEQERPDNILIEPEQYAEFFAQCWHSASVVSNVQWKLAPAPLAPYHASPTPWTDYAQRMYRAIAAKNITPGFLAVHAYLRGAQPADVWSKDMMGAPLQNTYSGFLTYLDAINLFPDNWGHLPVHITEINELLPDGWLDQNTGVVKEVYKNLNWYNEQGQDFKVQSGILYRYPHHDKWYIEGKNEVLADFREAATIGYRSPTAAPDSTKTVTLMPSIQKAPNVAPSPSTSFEIDNSKYPVEWVKVSDNGASGWLVKLVKFLDKERSGGRHHAYVETLDEAGNPISGVPFVFGWPAKEVSLKSNNRYGFDAANHPFSPGAAAFHVRLPSGPKVEGIGMGQLVDGHFNPGEHTSFVVTFQRGAATPTEPKPEPKPEPQPEKVPTLNMPFDHDWPVSQIFGVNGEYYKRFKVDGVPLKGHNGIDFAIPVGVPIFAVDDGVVVEMAEDVGGYGKYVKLRHLWGETLYAHLDSFNVRLNQAVDTETMLGQSGNTGNSTGPHLHFGLRTFPYNRRDGMGGYSDPALYLPLEKEKEEEQPPIGSGPVDPAILSAIHQAAVKYKQDYHLLASLAWAESSFRPYIKDGLFQIGDAAWSDWATKVGATDRNNPVDNALVGAAYFRFLLNRYQGNYYKALYAWNWGPGNVDAGGEPPAITKEFASKVLHGRDLLDKMMGG